MTSLAGLVGPNLLSFPTFPLNLSIDLDSLSSTFQEPFEAASAAKNIFISKERFLVMGVDPAQVGVLSGRVSNLVGGATNLGGLTGASAIFNNTIGTLANPIRLTNPISIQVTISSISAAIKSSLSPSINLNQLGNISSVSTAIKSTLPTSLNQLGNISSASAAIKNTLSTSIAINISSVSAAIKSTIPASIRI